MIPKAERRIAVILGDAGRDTAQRTIDVLRTLKADGYRVETVPADGEALIRALPAGPSDDGEETFQRGDYGIYFTTLPRDLQDSVNQRWGAPERDPAFRESRLDCGAFALPAIRCGNVVIAIAPRAEGAPRHGALALYAWLADSIRAQAVVHLGERGEADPALTNVPQLRANSDAEIADVLKSLDR